MSYLTYQQIRQKMYVDQRKWFKDYGEDMDDYRSYPYSAIKARIYIEAAAIIVYIFQHTNVQPNQLTVVYALLGPISIGMVMSQNTYGYMFAVFSFMFLKAFIDWSDGALARIKNSCSSVGAILDPWGATVNSYSFQICIGLYVFNTTGNIGFLYLLAAILFIRAIDLKEFRTAFLGRTVIEGGTEKGKKGNLRSEATTINNRSLLYKLFLIGTVFIDDRARMVDTILCLMLIEYFFMDGAVVSQTIHLLIFIGVLVRFLAGFYVVYFNKDFSGSTESDN